MYELEKPVDKVLRVEGEENEMWMNKYTENASEREE